jgi:hypothetical protein
MIYKDTLLIVSEVVRFHLFSKECAYIENSKIWIYCTYPENVEVINVVCQVPLMSQIMIVRMFVHSVLVNICHLVKCVSSAVHNVNGQHIGESEY